MIGRNSGTSCQPAASSLRASCPAVLPNALKYGLLPPSSTLLVVFLSYRQPFTIRLSSSYNPSFTANSLRYGNSGWRVHSRASLKHGLIMFKVTYETRMAGAHCGCSFLRQRHDFCRTSSVTGWGSSYGLRSYRCEPDQHNCCEGTCSFPLSLCVAVGARIDDCSAQSFNARCLLIRSRS